MSVVEPLTLPRLSSGHEECDDSRCRTCSATHMALMDYIDQRVYAFYAKYDTLGRYRYWLEHDRSIFCETPHGWADTRYFAEENVNGFIRHVLEVCADPENADDPSMQIPVAVAP